MTVRYKTSSGKVIRDFTSIEVVKNKRLFLPALYSLVGVSGEERIVIKSGLTKRQANSLYNNVLMHTHYPLLYGGVADV